MIDKIAGRVERLLKERRRQKMMLRFGGIQTCTWCRQCAQDEEGWRFDAAPDDSGLDVLTCGVCGGTSLWLFGMGMHFMRPLLPPKPKFTAAE